MTDHNKNTTGPISKKQLLAEMQSEQAAWLALLDEIGEENMTQPEVAGGWSIKDIVAHITGWRRRTVLRFRAALDPTIDMTPPWPAEMGELDEDDDVDEINAWIYKTNRDRPLCKFRDSAGEICIITWAAEQARVGRKCTSQPCTTVTSGSAGSFCQKSTTIGPCCE